MIVYFAILVFKQIYFDLALSHDHFCVCMYNYVCVRACVVVRVCERVEIYVFGVRVTVCAKKPKCWKNDLYGIKQSHGQVPFISWTLTFIFKGRSFGILFDLRISRKWWEIVKILLLLSNRKSCIFHRATNIVHRDLYLHFKYHKIWVAAIWKTLRASENAQFVLL